MSSRPILSVLAIVAQLALLACLSPRPTHGQPLPIDAALLNALTEEAATNHPGLAAARHRERAAEKGTEAVRLWPDPMLQIGGSRAAEMGPDLEMEGDLQFMVQQSLPLFGKSTAERQEATAAAAVAGAATQLRSQLLRRSVVQAIQQLALDDTTLRIGAEDLELQDRMASLARERQRAGLDSGLELLRIENEREKRRQQQVTDQLQRDFDRASLNRLLGRPLDRSFPEVALPAAAPAVPLNEELFRLAVRFEPKLQMMRRELDMADAGVEVTRRSRHPDVSLGAQTQQWSGTGGLREGMLFASLNLPWFNRGKYRADLERDRARADAARAEAEDYERDVRQEIFRVWTRMDAARRESALYQDRILPRARLAVETALASWSTGRAMYLEVHEARRMLVEARLMQARAIVEQHRMIAELVTCCGVADLDALIMLPPPESATPAIPSPRP